MVPSTTTKLCSRASKPRFYRMALANGRKFPPCIRIVAVRNDLETPTFPDKDDVQ
jgi:hypothetical protein